MTSIEAISPRAVPSMVMKMAVAKVVLVTIDTFVPVRVVAKNHSGDSRSF
jgi:hypothetical protein